MSAEERVRAVLRAAARLASPDDPLGREARRRLPASTGLSPESVSRALERSLETAVSDDEIAQLIASVSPASSVLIILSANVFTAAARALSLALASSPNVRVRASRRGPVFPELLVRALSEDGIHNVSLTARDELREGEHAHVYGRDETVAAVRASAPPGCEVWGHGAGLGIAAIDESTDVESAANALAEDVVAFDQRGCLSPRIALVFGSETFAKRFSLALTDSLVRLRREVPIGVVEPAERAAFRAYADTMAIAGELLGSEGATVGLDLSPRVLTLPPLPRVLHVARVDDTSRAIALVAPMARSITVVGGDDAFSRDLAHSLPCARTSALGAMQRPPLDGPVDRRTPAPRTRL